MKSSFKQLKEKIKNCDVIVIGAGSGLSTSAGYTYSGSRFTQYFSDFQQKYGFEDMYSGGFYPYETLEEYWAYWSRYIYINRYMEPEKNTYQKLLHLVKDKDYFVLTTNVDHCFQREGFDKRKLFYTQGDYGLFQCMEPCHNQTYDNEEIIKKMYTSQKDMKIPSELIPYCPRCGKPMCMNLRVDSTFVQDEGWYKAAQNYTNFIDIHKNKNILFLDLGTGCNTPAIIKYPFWKMTNAFKNATYASINLEAMSIPDAIKEKSILIHQDIDTILNLL